MILSVTWRLAQELGVRSPLPIEKGLLKSYGRTGMAQWQRKLGLRTETRGA